MTTTTRNLFTDQIEPVRITRTGISWTGTYNPFILSQGSISGVLTQSTVAAAHVFNINNDGVDASSANGSYNGYFGHVLNSAGAKGNKTALAGVMVVSHATGNTSGGAFYTGNAGIAQAIVNDGGTAPALRGNLFGGFDSSSLLGTATFWNSCVGREIDVEIRNGCSAGFKIGLQIVQRFTDVVAGSIVDTAIGVANQTGGAPPRWSIGMSFGTANGIWPIKDTGTIIGTQATLLGGPSYAAAYGVDFSAVTFSTAAFKSTGFSVAPDGGTAVKTIAVPPITAPAAPASGWIIYCDTGDANKLKAKASNGTVALLGTP